MPPSQLWTQIDTYNGCEINKVDGAKYVEIKVSSDKTSAGQIKVTEYHWLFTTDFKLFFFIIIGLVSYTQLNAWYRTQKFQDWLKKRK